MLILRPPPSRATHQGLGRRHLAREEPSSFVLIGAGGQDDGLSKGMVRPDEELVSLVEPADKAICWERRELPLGATVAVLAGEDKVPRSVEIDAEAPRHQRVGDEVVDIRMI